MWNAECGMHQMRRVECGMWNVRVRVARPTTFHCNSAFRIPHSAFLRPPRHNFGYVDRGRIGRFASVRSGIRTDPSQWTDERHRRGIAGEEQAIRYLLSRGCTIVAHRFRVGHTEIDLIARQGDLVTFVEVKTRRGRAFGSPLLGGTGGKRREVGKAARAWGERFREAEGIYPLGRIAVVERARGPLGP